MLAFKKSNVLYKFINTSNSIRWKLCARNFATIADNQTTIKTTASAAQSQTLLRHNQIMSLFPSMEAEMQKNDADYMNVFPDVVRELTDYSKFTLLPNDFKVAEDHFIKMLDHCLSGGHRDQMITLIKMYRDLMVNKEITAENIEQAHLLGWCMEILLCASIINDDFLDNAEIRRGKACWYKVEGMGKGAITDMLLLENGCHVVISRFFGHLPCYSAMMKTVTETFMIAMLSHTYELLVRTKMGPNHFSLKSYNYMNIMKAAYQRFYMPAAIAMLLAGYDFNTNQKSFEAVKLISNEIGPFFQAQNDYLDIFDGHKFLKKPGNDIQNGQFSWLAAMAMELGTEQQKNIMRNCYGKNDAHCVAKVKQLYKELRLPEVFNAYKERNRNEVMHLIEQLLNSDPTLRNACITYFSQGYEINTI